jgi:hypothetical protein
MGKLLNVLINSTLLCHHDNIYQGKWAFTSDTFKKDELGMFSQCSLLGKQKIHSSGKSLIDHATKYGCMSRKYLEAYFIPNHCDLLPRYQSLPLLREMAQQIRTQSANISSPYRVTFIGDSIMGQIFVSATCYFEKHVYPEVELTYIHELFLRNDIPCDDRYDNFIYYY